MLSMSFFYLTEINDIEQASGAAAQVNCSFCQSWQACRKRVIPDQGLGQAFPPLGVRATGTQAANGSLTIEVHPLQPAGGSRAGLKGSSLPFSLMSYF
jgi:hypothetical protein